MKKDLLSALSFVAVILVSLATYARLRGGGLGFGFLDRDSTLGHLAYFVWVAAITSAAAYGMPEGRSLVAWVRSATISVAVVVVAFMALAFRAQAFADFDEFARFELAPGSLLGATLLATLVYFLSRSPALPAGGSASFPWVATSLIVSAGIVYVVMMWLSINEHVRNTRQFVAVAVGLHLPALFLFAARANGQRRPAMLALGTVLLLAAAWL